MITNCSAYKAALAWQAKVQQLALGNKAGLSPEMANQTVAWANRMNTLISATITTFLNSVPVGP